MDAASGGRGVCTPLLALHLRFSCSRAAFPASFFGLSRLLVILDGEGGLTRLRVRFPGLSQVFHEWARGGRVEDGTHAVLRFGSGYGLAPRTLPDDCASPTTSEATCLRSHSDGGPPSTSASDRAHWRGLHERLPGVEEKDSALMLIRGARAIGGPRSRP